MIGKIVVSVISLILVVGVVIGVLTAVHRRSESSTSSDDFSPLRKAVTEICQPTNYKEACTKALGASNTTDPKELIQAGIMAISSSLSKSMKLSDELVVKAGSKPRTKVALEDCKTLLKQANEDLDDILGKMSNINLKTISEQADEFRIWLSSIISYRELCMDGFDEDNEVKAEVGKSTEFGNQLTDNVLTILGGISDILKSFSLEFNIPATDSRRLLEANEYPAWLSAADRKLLEAGDTGKLPPNAVVALDGSGQFKSISAAINSYPTGHKGRFVIYVKAGIYDEEVVVPRTNPDIYMYGDGPTKTIVTGKKNYASGVNTWNTAPFGIDANGFICKDMGFENTAGPTGLQAVALRVNSDMAVFYNCKLDGYQDTLLYQAGRQFYRDCVISGTIDFLFGFGVAYIQNSQLVVRKPNSGQYNAVTADGKQEKGQTTGLVIHNCSIVPDKELARERLTIKTYLGRPWKQHCTTIVMESELGDFIQPEGWMDWPGKEYAGTLFYGEYGNTGPGANTSARVKWSTFQLLNKDEAQKWTLGAFLPDAAQWIGAAGVPFLAGLR